MAMILDIIHSDCLTVANNDNALLIFQVLTFETKLLVPFLEQVIRKYALHEDMYQVVKVSILSTFKEFPFQNMVPTLDKKIHIRVK